jgi:hypothetical protein
MADPIVHITNGIPDLGTGNITTLGQTLADGANGTLGAVADVAIVAGAAGTINAHLRTISRDIAGGIVLQGGAATIGNVGQAGAPWSQNITQFGGVAISTGTGIGGTGIPRVTVSSDSSLAATQSGSWDIRNITGSVPLPTGASTSAKQPALGTSGTPSADVLTVQGISGMTALKVDGTGGTFPVSGTLAVTQSGTWNITNISGTVSLPTGAATAAKQPAPSTAGSPSADVLSIQGVSGMTAVKINLFGNAGAALDFAGQNATGTINSQLVGGQFNTAPTAITSGNFSPLQLDSAANLLVNVKAGVPAVGTFGSAFPSTGTAIGAKDSGGTLMAAMNLDASGNLKVNVAAGGASGGTSSSFGAAVPGTGTAAGFSDGTNMQLAHVWDADSGVGTQWVQGVLLKTPASGGAVDIGVSGQPLRTDPTGTTTQPISGSVTVTQGTAANLNATVTGTVTANQGGTWNITNISGTVSLPTGAATSANQPTAAALGSTTSGQTGTLSLGAVTTAAPTYVTAQTNALSLTTAGALRVDNSGVTQPVSGTVTANQGGTWNINNISGTVSLPTGASTAANQPTNVAIASTTAGQTGHLAMGSVTTAAPTYTTGQSDPLSLTTAGALRVDGSSVTQPVSGTFWQATQPVSIAATVNVSAAQSGNWTSRVVGNAGAIMDFAGQNVAAPANSLLVGGEFNTTPTTITSGNASPLQLDSAGNLLVNIKAGAGSGGTASTFGAAFPATGTAIGVMNSAGTAMTNLKVNASGALVTDGSAVTQPVSGTFWQTTQPISAASLPLPAGASTSANQPTAAAVASTTSGQTGTLAFGATTTGAPAYTTAQSNPLSLTTAGNLRVDGSSVTQPVSGTFWQATQPVSGSVSITGTATISGTVTANQGGAPWTMKPDGTVWTLTGTSANVNVTNASIAVTGTFWQATQPVSIAAAVTVAQATAANLNATVTGTVTSNQGGAPWTVNPGTAANWGIGSSTQNSATVANGQMVLGQFNTSPTAITSGNMSPLQLDGSGNLRVNIMAGGGAGGTSSTVGAAMPATATVAMGSVTTAAPAYTTATANALSLDTSGSLRCNSTIPIFTTGPTWNSVTANNTTTPILNNNNVGTGNICGSINQTTTITGGQLTFEESYDGGLNWKSIPATRLIDPIAGSNISNPYSLQASTNQPFVILDVGVTQVRVRLSPQIAGTGTVIIYSTTAPISNFVQISASAPVAVSQSGAPWQMMGDLFPGGTDSASQWPVKIGGRAATVLPTAVSDGQRVPAMYDKLGKAITAGAIRTTKGVQKTSITVATETTVITAGGAGVFNDVYAIVITNKSATSVFVDFRDSTAGTVRMTLAAPASDTRGFTVPVDSAMIQNAAANNWTATVSSAVSSIEITMLYVQNS